MRRITFWLAILLIFMIPWEDSISVAALGSMARIIGLFVAAFWIATMLIDGRFRKPGLFHVLVLLFFLWNFVSIFWSMDTASTIQRIKTYTQVFLLMLILWDVFQTPESLMTGLQAYIFGAYVAIASTISNYSKGDSSVAYQGRYSATGVNAVDLALILLLGLPIAMHLFLAAEESKKGIILKLIYLAYIPLAIFAVMLTGSRTSLIAVIPFGIYFIGNQQIKSSRKLLVFGILFISLLALLPFIPQSVSTRLGTLGASIESADLGGRVKLWGAAIIALSNHPFLGLGSGTMRSVIGTIAHNTYISVAAETGFIGFVLFFIILVVVLFQAMNIPNGKSGLWVAIFLTWIIGVCSLSWEFRKPTWLFLSFIILEGNFTYEQLYIGQSKVKISKSIKRFLNVNELEIKTEAN